jgi:diguanylate cyclase (GGDEF)-like protein
MDAIDAATILEKIETYLAAPPKTLRFDRAIEADFRRDRAAARGWQAYYGGLIAVLAFNVLLDAEYANHEIPAESAAAMLWASHLIVTIPCLLLIYAINKRRDAKLLELMMAAGYVLVTIGSVVINLHMAGDVAVYDAYTSVLILITCNLALPMSFVTATVGSAFSVTALVLGAAIHPGFAPEARTSLSLLYVVGAVMTLTANYRFELADRVNYLNVLRERMRNDDISRANALLSQMSRTDFLTGLPNRRDFDERLAEAMRQACRDGAALSLLVLDIDNFKLYNDVLGHPKGDRCLKKVAQAIAANIGADGAFVGRIGGEEFAVALPAISGETAAAVAERIREAIHALMIPHPGLGPQRQVTVSLGAASLNPDWPEDSASLVARADAALYRAKRGGRNRTEFDFRIVA